MTYPRGMREYNRDMNPVFAGVFFASALLFLFARPEAFLSALLAGGQKAAVLSLSLLSSYCVWLGFFRVMEASGLSQKLSRLAVPLTRRLFRSNDQNALFLASSNLTANFLGLPGAPTPLGIRAAAAFSEQGNDYAADMLFVLNATSLQILPTTALSLMLSAGAAAPYSILLPTILATLFSTLTGALLVRLTAGRKK